MALLDVVALVLLGWIAQPTSSCGIVTHITLAQRATEYFEVKSGGVDYRQLVLKHQDAFQAGNPFPDTFYNSLCRGGKFHSVSEDTHWTPFANATVNYIRRKYPQPWSADTEKLVAFLFGVVAHSVSDASWHSLGIDQGFLRAMGHTNFLGSFNRAHSTGDFGGDVVNMIELDTSDVGFLDNWYIPTSDLVEIYKEYYGYAKMDAQTINECAIWMYLGRAGEKLGVINLLYPRYSKASPFLVNRMQDYFLGAMDDMAVWTTNSWRNIITMIDNGPGACDLKENPLYVKCDTNNDVMKSDGKRPQRSKRGTDEVGYIRDVIKGLDDTFITMETTGRGVYIKANDNLKKLARSKMAELEARRTLDLTHEETPASSRTAQVVHPAAFYDTAVTYARLGRSLASADVNHDGHGDLIIGAPGHGSMGNAMQGRVYVVYGGADGLPRKNLTLEKDANLTLNGPDRNGQFGHAVAIADLNSDGLNDLVVGSPTVGSGELTYHGAVYVHLGQKAGGFSSTPNMTVTCKQKYCGIGWSLASADVNNDGFDDVIIGAPFAPAKGEQNGFVGAIFSKKELKSGTTMDETQLDWVYNGPQRYSWFGYSVAATKSHLAVGAPSHRICVWSDCSYNQDDIQAAGKVFVFKTPLTSASLEWRTYLGDKQFDYLGASVRFGNFDGKDNTLAFGVPSKDIGWPFSTNQAGVTRVYDVTITGSTKKVEYRSKRSYSRFGSATWFEDANGDGTNDILVASPHWTDGFWFSSGELQGRVFVFDGTKASGNINEADMELVYAEDKAKFGTAISSVRLTDGVDLIVSAPSSNAKAKLGGRITLFPQNK